MAYMTKNIPTLTGKDAERFIRLADKAESKPHAGLSKQRLEEIREFIRKSQEVAKTLPWNL
jgi:hypothetical protein